jgi:hypothetical protein
VFSGRQIPPKTCYFGRFCHIGLGALIPNSSLSTLRARSHCFSPGVDVVHKQTQRKGSNNGDDDDGRSGPLVLWRPRCSLAPPAPRGHALASSQSSSSARPRPDVPAFYPLCNRRSHRRTARGLDNFRCCNSPVLG